MKKKYKKEINSTIIEILSKKSHLTNEIKKMEFQKKDSLNIMLLINAFNAMIFSVVMVGMVTSAFIAIPKALSIITPIFLMLSGVNTVCRIKKIIKCNKIINSYVEQQKYLSKKLEELELLQKKPKIKVDNIKTIKDWNKKFALVKEYAKYKKMFIKEYKKGKLASTLKNSYYTVSEMKYLFDKTEEDYLEKENIKKLLKNRNKKKN